MSLQWQTHLFFHEHWLTTNSKSLNFASSITPSKIYLIYFPVRCHRHYILVGLYEQSWFAFLVETIPKDFSTCECIENQFVVPIQYGLLYSIYSNQNFFCFFFFGSFLELSPLFRSLFKSVNIIVVGLRNRYSFVCFYSDSIL